ncbi:hypothetical protein IQ07DRAFT_590847 [Pyrenochaeta sp. DS3sAY3a]|nr:hypothetical protein IQ07DRAFT_590847 [Pyrenochaeta sp. DS3sAY3a]
MYHEYSCTILAKSQSIVHSPYPEFPCAHPHPSTQMGNTVQTPSQVDLGNLITLKSQMQCLRLPPSKSSNPQDPRTPSRSATSSTRQSPSHNSNSRHLHHDNKIRHSHPLHRPILQFTYIFGSHHLNSHVP